jgi:hypothetical protein
MSRFAEFKKVEKIALSPLSSLVKPKLHKKNRGMNTFGN